MSIQYPAATLFSARKVIRNGMAEVLHLTHGDLPQAFGMARQYCLDMAEACKVAEIELADYEVMKIGSGNAALRSVAESIWCESADDMEAALLNPDEDAALDEIEMREAEAIPRHVDPFFAPVLNPVSPRQEAI